METVGDELDGDVVLRPMAVDLVPVAVDVRAGGAAGRAGSSSEEEAVLEVTEGDVRAERTAQLRDAGLVRVASDGGLDVDGVVRW